MIVAILVTSNKSIGCQYISYHTKSDNSRPHSTTVNNPEQPSPSPLNSPAHTLEGFLVAEMVPHFAPRGPRVLRVHHIDLVHPFVTAHFLMAHDAWRRRRSIGGKRDAHGGGGGSSCK